MFRTLVLLFAGLVWLASCGGAPKDTNVVKVIQVDGQVTIEKGDGKGAARAYLGSDLMPNDSVKTGPGSRAKVQIGERAVVSIEPNSVVRMRDIRKDGTTGQENTRIEFKGGRSMVNITKKLGSQDNFDVMTPSAVAGVRGTEFLVDTEDPASSRIAVTKGSVAVRKRIAALDDAPAASMPVAVREALRELAANQEVPVRVNEEVAVDKKASEAVSAIVETVVQKVTAEMKAVASDTTKTPEAKRAILEESLGAIITTSQTRIEAAPEARPVSVAPLSEETKKKVETIEVVAPVPVETLKTLPVKKDGSVKDIRDVLKTEESRKSEKAAPVTAAAEDKAVATVTTPVTRTPSAPVVGERPAVTRTVAATETTPVKAVTTPVATPEPVREAPTGTFLLNIQPEGSFASVTKAEGGAEIRLQPGANKLPAGRYTLRTDKRGFKPQEEVITVESGATVERSIRLVAKLVASEKIVLLDGSTVSGKVLSRSETEVVIETENGVRKIDPRKIDEIIYLKKN